MPSVRPTKLAWCVIGGTAVFLDIAADRYFRLNEAGNANFLATLDGDCSGPQQPASFPLPQSWRPPAGRHPAMDEGPFRIGDVAAALWTQRRVERRLALKSFEHVLHEFSRSVSALTTVRLEQEEHVARTIRAFQLGRLLRTAADRCLPRSIALALRLTRHQYRAHVVLGVKLSPFAAHCWAQCADMVVNDELEEVRRYTPILVL